MQFVFQLDLTKFINENLIGLNIIEDVLDEKLNIYVIHFAFLYTDNTALMAK